MLEVFSILFSGLFPQIPFGSTMPTLIVPFQQHPCTLSGKCLLSQLPFPPNSDF